MLLITCKECGKEVSDQATNCPNCGAPTYKPVSEGYKIPMAPNTQKSNNQSQSPEKMKNSGMSVLALIFGVIGCTFIISVILAIIDLVKKDDTKKHTLSIIALVISGVWVITALIYGVSSDDVPTSTDNAVSSMIEQPTLQPEQNSQDVMAETDDTIEDITEEPVIEDAVLPTVGQSVENEDWKISFLDAKEYTSIEDEFYIDEPVDGKIYLILYFEAENISEEDNYINSLYFEAYEDGYGIDLSIIFNDPDGYSSFGGDVAAGKKIKGCLAYEVSPEWTEFEVSYKEWILTSDKIATFKVTPNELSN